MIRRSNIATSPCTRIFLRSRDRARVERAHACYHGNNLIDYQYVFLPRRQAFEIYRPDSQGTQFRFRHIT